MGAEGLSGSFGVILSNETVSNTNTTVQASNFVEAVLMFNGCSACNHINVKVVIKLSACKAYKFTLSQ
jgi:hypothetical protein